MGPLGHLGVALLLFAPFAYVLLVRNRAKHLAPALVVGLVLTNAPDIDLYTSMFAHRGLTHTFLAVGVLATVTALLWGVSTQQSLGNRFGRARFGFLVGAISGLAHLLGDVITPMGIQPFLPWNDTVYTLSLVYAADPVANVALLACGVVALSTSIHLAESSVPRATDLAEEATVDAGVPSDSDPG